MLPPAPGGLEPLPPSLPLAAAPSDASFPQRWGAVGAGWAARTGCCPAPARPEGPPGGGLWGRCGGWESGTYCQWDEVWRRARLSLTSARRSGHAKRVAAHPGPGPATLRSPRSRAPSPAWEPGAARLLSTLQPGAERSCGERGRMGLIPVAMASPASPGQAVLAPCLPGAGTAGSRRHCLWLGTRARGPARAGPGALGTDPPGEGVHPPSTAGL